MKISILASLFALASVNHLAVAADEKRHGLRGDAKNRDLGLVDMIGGWFNNGDGELPDDPTVGSDLDLGDINLEGLDLVKLMEGFEQLRELMENLKPLLDQLPVLLQNMDMLEVLLPLLGGALDADSGCPTKPCSECDTGMFASLTPGEECVDLEYIEPNPKTGEFRQRCVPEQLAGFLVGTLQRYKCAGDE